MSGNLNCESESFLEFESLAQTVHKDLYVFLYSMCKDNEIANDALQNAFIKGFKSFNTLKDTEDFKSWMFTIGKREMFTILQKNKKHQAENLEMVTNDKVIMETKENPEEEYLVKEKKKMVMNAIESLKEDMREIILMKYYHNLSFEKIAKIQGINVNTIRSKHMRAKGYIKEYLCKTDSI
ncbi:RNA polymerase sigma factor [Oceanirhabdus seepicola]|uniref:Sigma-70 family RNA polymerase sigma factor n=1 Tax=Oceanirhabdus seepicola TaxID=2828781 RepID=A0A9J6P1B5_9CLOT|nr:sigma-70 family RNA polymerase sigma factor [Oceanirhabdus seepicola]MCM1989240.1 sigma-70 family RNA polymerase sigma factor [Oceanirhabdus seepicola]